MLIIVLVLLSSPLLVFLAWVMYHELRDAPQAL
jgi:hypothetical protein